MTSNEEALAALMASLGGCRTIDELLRALPSALAKMTKFEELALCLLPSESDGEFDARPLTGAGRWSGRMPMQASAVHAAVEKGGPLAEAGIGKYSNYFDVRKLGEAGLQSYAIFPLSCEGKIFATLNFASAGEKTFGQDTMHALAAASDYIAKLLYALMRSERARQKGTSEAIAGILPHTYFALDSDFRLSSVDGAPDAMLGYTAAELNGMRLSNIVHSDDYKRLDSVLKDLAAGQKIRGVDFTFLAKSGEHKRFELRGAKSGKAVGCVLLPPGSVGGGENDKLYSLIVHNSSDAIYTMDAFGVVRTWNKAAEALFGYPPGEIVGTEAKRLFEAESTAELDDMMRRLREGGGTLTKKTTRIRKGGKPIIVLSSSSALIDGDGKIIGYMEALRDLSALVKLSEKDRELRQQAELNKKLQRDIEDSSKFISDVSHELRTPLTNIKGYTSLLLEQEGEGKNLSGQQKEFLQIIYNETLRFSKLIDDVLDLSKMESRKTKLSPKQFDPRSLQERCSCMSEAQKKGLYVQWNFANDVTTIYGDPNHVARILLNLISNAIKFTSSGGITVNVKNKSRAYVLFEVSDTGVGISPEEKSKLFKRFSQLSYGANRQGGTGLGLAITKELVQMHGGKIDVRSEPGKGSTFFFTLKRNAPKGGRKGE